MSYISTGFFGTGPQVQAINQALKASAAASPEQLYPPLAPLKFKKESNMYVASGALPGIRTVSAGVQKAYDDAQGSVVQVPGIGQVKKTYLYFGAAAIAAVLILKKLKKI